jgi:hypothetical protein
MDKHQTELEENTEKFFKTVEAGDIALFDTFEETIAVFGFTKVGKTCSCHMLCGSPLKSIEQRGELIYKAASQRFINAKIGQTTESETEIPNIFEGFIRVKDDPKPRKIWVLDQPGYGDTYGFHRIFSNGYFHYRTFSKTPKLKFVLAISKNDLTGTADKFKKTIFNFINSFKQWEAVQEKILKATSILITKADPNTQQDNIKNILTNLRDSTSGMGLKQKAKYQSLINDVLNNSRFYFIERPRTANQGTLDLPILQKIYDNSYFW